MKMLEVISAPEAAKKWGISERRVHGLQKLCKENRIPRRSKVQPYVADSKRC